MTIKTIDEAKDQILGKVGTKRRDNYEKDLKRELSKKTVCNEHPILFSTPMVQANLEGRKTNTRRLNGLEEINGDPDTYKYHGTIPDNPLIHCFARIWKENHVQSIHRKCPYGQPGDFLWVRETMVFNKNSNTYWPIADGYVKTADYEKVVPSIHVPKEHARIWLEVEEIRVERLNDISEEDAIAEGILSKKIQNCFWYDDYLQPNTFPHANPIDSFKSLFLSINGKPKPQREFGEKGKIVSYTAIAWDQQDFDIKWPKYHGIYRNKPLEVHVNPWVWVVKYKVLSTSGKPEIKS